MALNYNRVIIAGNLTRDPEVRTAGSGQVAGFGIASNRKYKNSAGETVEEVTFVDIEAWGRTAELCGQYLSKGRGALIEGRLKLDKFTDRDGNDRQKLKVVADNVQFLGGAKEHQPERQAAHAADPSDPPF